jgi:hypothetical protein
VHLEQRAILLPRAKGGGRAVILNDEAQKILRSQLEKHQGSEWVFPNPDGAPYSRIHVSRVFRKAARAAGLKSFRFHDLRHHGATMALNAGFTAPVVRALGGWKSEAMMRRYAAVTDQTLRAAAEAVRVAVRERLGAEVRAMPWGGEVTASTPAPNTETHIRPLARGIRFYCAMWQCTRRYAGALAVRALRPFRQHDPGSLLLWALGTVLPKRWC